MVQLCINDYFPHFSKDKVGKKQHNFVNIVLSFSPFFVALGPKLLQVKYSNFSLTIQKSYRIIISMMEVFVEPPKISEEILVKIAGGIINKYETREINNIFNFMQDSHQAVQEMKLYSNTLSQLYLEVNSPQNHLFAIYHTQLFRIVDFLLKTIQKKYNKRQTHNQPTAFLTLCSNCGHHIHQRNVRNMHQEILDYHRYSAQMLDEELKRQLQTENSKDQEVYICSEGYLRKKMYGLQKNIEERHNNLLECIEDFEELRSNLVFNTKKRDSVGDLNAFNMREYLFGMTEHFVATLRKIEVKISNLRKSTITYQNKDIQVCLEKDNIVTAIPIVEPLKVPTRMESDLKKVSNMNKKLEQSNKKAQSQIKDLIAKIETLEFQNKKLKEDIFIEKIKNGKENTTKIAQKIEEKTKRQNIQKHKKTTLIDNIQSIFCESADFGYQFTTTLQQNFKVKDLTKQEDIMPIMKTIFKKTLEKYTNQRSSMVLQKKMSLKRNQTESIEIERRKSRKKTLRIQIEPQNKQSRYSLKKTQRKQFYISQAYSLKLSGDKFQFSMNSISQSSFKTTQKDMVYPLNENQKRKKLAKLSIFSELRQQLEQPKVYNNPVKRHRQSTDYSRQKLVAGNIANSKIVKKSTFKRNKSQQDYTSSPSPKIQQSFKVIKLKEKGIDNKIVQSFLLLEDQFWKRKEKENRLSLEQRSKYVLEGQSDLKIPRQKIVLNLDELNYLTLLFSLFARVHLVNTNVYEQIKEWILKSSKVKNIEDSSQNMVLRKLVSEIIYRHRQCGSTPTLCIHLTDFLQSIERSLIDSQFENLEQGGNNFVE